MDALVEATVSRKKVYKNRVTSAIIEFSKSHKQPEGTMNYDIRAVLWDNICKIMALRYGKDNLLRISGDTGLAINTFTRLKDGHTYVSLKTIEAIAQQLGYEPWALICPTFDAADPPVTALTASQSKANAQMLEAIAELVK